MDKFLDNRHFDVNLKNHSIGEIDRSKEELRETLKRYRKRLFSKEEVFSIQAKIIKDKELIQLFHFTDIWYLKNILSKGMSGWPEVVCSNINNCKSIEGIQYSDALGSYRALNESEFLNQSQFRGGKHNYITGMLHNNRIINEMKRYTTEKKNINNQELKIVRVFYKKYLKYKNLDFFSEEEIDIIHEIFTRINARTGWFTFNYDNNNHLKSSMNTCLVFDKEDVSSKTDIFGVERGFDLGTKYRIKNNSEIKGIMIYKINLAQVLETIVETVKSIDNIMPIYDYDGNILWPR